MIGAALVVGARLKVAALICGDGGVVDAGLAPAHQAVLVELPELVAVGAEPLAAGVVPLVLEPDGHAVFPESPQALAQDVVELAFRFGGEELDDRGPTGEEDVAVTPDRVLGVGEADALGVAGLNRLGHVS